MKSLSMKHYAIFLFVLLIGTLPVNVKAEEDIQEAMKADKTGTNPINFTYDLRFYNEYQWLNIDKNGRQNISTLEFRAPFADGKWQFRTRLRRTSFKADLTGDGITDADDSGFGDMDFRFLTVPYFDMSKKMAIAVGFETFLNTASEDSLGSGATSLGPQVFGVFFKPFGGFFDLIAPAYQHKFSIDEESGASDVEQGLIDLFFLKTSEDKLKWALINPQIILDYEKEEEYMLIDFEVGTMLDKYIDAKGHSMYLRPSVSIGGDRPTDASIEVGYKIVW